MNRTPIADQEQKLDIIDHINQDHSDELLAIAHHYYPNDTFESVLIKDIFNEGMVLEVIPQSSGEMFIPFELKGELEEQILYLAYLAMVKQGKNITGGRRHYFTVKAKENVTKRIIRVHLSSDTPILPNHDGYAYGMVLKTIQSIKPPPSVEITSPISKVSSWLTTRANLAFLWVLKRVSSEKRKKIVENMTKDVRIYTLRVQENGESKHYDTYMDIYVHGDSAGYRWLNSLSVGSIIYARTESPEKHHHLDVGKAVLIADETAYPAAASILERWNNVLAPTVIVLSQHTEEQAYFDTVKLPIGTVIHNIAMDTPNQSAEVIAYLEQLTDIQTVWGACENTTAKKIRHYLRYERQLSGKNNHLKGYWRME